MFFDVPTFAVFLKRKLEYTGAPKSQDSIAVHCQVVTTSGKTVKKIYHCFSRKYEPFCYTNNPVYSPSSNFI
jgi:hypothetical protein